MLKEFDESDRFLSKNKQAYSTPWEDVNRLFKFREGELTKWVSQTGDFASTLMRHLVIDHVSQEAKVGLIYHDNIRDVIHGMTRQWIGSELGREGAAHIDDFLKTAGPNIFGIDISEIRYIPSLLRTMRSACDEFGANVIVIDCMTYLDINEYDATEVKDFMESLCLFKDETKAHVHLLIHAEQNATTQFFLGQPKLEPNMYSDRGGSCTSNYADNCICLYKPEYEPDHKDEDPDLFLICEKSDGKLTSWKKELWFDEDSFQFKEKWNAPTKKYVN